MSAGWYLLGPSDGERKHARGTHLTIRCAECADRMDRDGLAAFPGRYFPRPRWEAHLIARPDGPGRYSTLLAWLATCDARCDVCKTRVPVILP